MKFVLLKNTICKVFIECVDHLANDENDIAPIRLQSQLRFHRFSVYQRRSL